MRPHLAWILWPFKILWKFKPTRWIMEKILNAFRPILTAGIAMALERPAVVTALTKMTADETEKMIIAEATRAT